MGDLNTVDVASTAHANALIRRGLYPEGEQMKHGHRVPSGKMWSGLYIDDYLLLFRISRERARLKDADTIRSEEVSRAYVAEGLEEEESKAFNQQLDFTSWGARIRGGKGEAGAPLAVRVQLHMITVALVTIGWATQNILQQVLGLYASIWLFRREFFSLFHHVYRFVDQMAPGKWARMPQFVLDEFIVAAFHLPLATANLRAPVCTEILATDATPGSGGATSALVPHPVAEALYRVSEGRGATLRLDGNSTTNNEERLVQRSTVTDALAKSLEWRVVSSYRFCRHHHINLQEARALRREIIQLASQSGEPRRQLVYCDSMVNVGAWGKGRSSSFKLNGILRSTLGYMVMGFLEVALVWISSGANPADYPSRFVPLPPPSSMPTAFRKFFESASRGGRRFGLELFAGVGVLTAVMKSEGVEMWVPYDIKYSVEFDLLNPSVFEGVIALIRSGIIAFVWLAPPCWSHSAAQNGRKGGALRSKEFPEGINKNDPVVVLGNKLWECALSIFDECCLLSVPATVEHPETAYSWRMPCTLRVLQRPEVHSVTVHMCCFPEPNKPRTKKPTRLMTTAPWIVSLTNRICQNDHSHDPYLCGSKARNAAQYSRVFCKALAHAYQKWAARAS